MAPRNRRWLLSGVAGLVVIGGAVLARGALGGAATDPGVRTASVLRGPLEVTLLEGGEVRAARDEKVAAPRVHGDLKIVHLWPEGARVEVGDLILQFDRTQYAQEVKDRAGALEQAKADHRRIVAVQERRRADLLVEVEKAKATLELAKINLDKAAYGSPVQQEEARIRLGQSERALQQARTNVDAQRIIDRVELANIALRITHRQKNYDRARSDYERLSVFAQRPGIVVYEQIRKRGTDRRGKVTEGDVVWGGTSLLSLPELDSMQVHAQVGEMDVHQVAPGQLVRIRLEAFPGPVFHGAVREVSPMASELDDAPNVHVFDMVVDIDERDDRLYPGMSASVEVIVESLTDVLSIPLAALREGAGHAVVYRRRGGRFEAVEVVLGTDNGQRVVVESGLQEGDVVALADLALP